MNMGQYCIFLFGTVEPRIMEIEAKDQDEAEEIAKEALNKSEGRYKAAEVYGLLCRVFRKPGKKFGFLPDL